MGKGSLRAYRTGTKQQRRVKITADPKRNKRSAYQQNKRNAERAALRMGVWS